MISEDNPAYTWHKHSLTEQLYAVKEQQQHGWIRILSKVSSHDVGLNIVNPTF